jgi:uncharacterized protein with PIN domain
MSKCTVCNGQVLPVDGNEITVVGSTHYEIPFEYPICMSCGHECKQEDISVS